MLRRIGLLLRPFNQCDSTEYRLNADTAVLAGKYNVYLRTQSGNQLLHRFKLPAPFPPGSYYLLIKDREHSWTRKLLILN